MIKLHVFGPAFGCIDPSPFVVKAHVLLRMAGLSYEAIPANFQNPPKGNFKGKYPVIEDDGAVVPDSTLIRFHIEKKYGFDFDKHLSPAERGAAWAFEKLCEDHLYWMIVHDRWMVKTNFERGPKHFFDKVPGLIRPFIIMMIGRQVKRNLWGQGSGRYTPEERAAIGIRGVRALAEYLEHRAFIGGDAPCGADASVFGTVESMLTTFFDSDLNREAQKYPQLAAYHARMKTLYFS